MSKSMKYRMLLKAFKIIPVKKIMAQPASKTQKLFSKAYKGVKIPELQDPELSISKGEVDGSTVLYIKHKKETDKLIASNSAVKDKPIPAFLFFMVPVSFAK